MAAAPSDLVQYCGVARVLVLSAPANTDRALVVQRRALGQASAGMTERAIVPLIAIGAGADAVRLRRAVRLPEGAFGIALVGKDGGVKLRTATPITAEALFATIDAMPMRQDEMRSR